MSGIVNFLSRALVSNQLVQTQSITQARNTSNPFSEKGGNPFVTSTPYAHYGQNRPVAGGYFAGYYNNQPNIVGRRLFIEV